MLAAVASLALLGALLSGCGGSFCGNLYTATAVWPDRASDSEAIADEIVEFDALAEQALTEQAPAEIYLDLLLISDTFRRFLRAVDREDSAALGAINLPAAHAASARVSDWADRNC